MQADKMNCKRCGNTLKPNLPSCLRCGALCEPKRTESTPASRTPLPPLKNQPPTPKEASHNPISEPNKPVNSNISWLVGAIAVVVFLAYVIEDPSSNLPEKEGSNADPATSSQTTDKQRNPPELSITESKPPVGTDHLLTANQIQYCLAENIRLSAMKVWIDNNIRLEVDRLNTSVDDYNSRCGSYTYREGSLISAKNSISGLDGQFRKEGRIRVQTWRQTQPSKRPIVNKNSNPKPRPSQIVREVQRILASLGYDPGQADGLTGKQTIAAVRQFQKDYGFHVDGVIDQPLYSRVYELRPRDLPTTQSSTTRQQQDQTSEFSSAEAACKHFKQGDPSNYQRCIGNVLSSAPQNPSIGKSVKESILSTSIVNKINAYCNSVNFTPGDYSKCVNREQKSLIANPLVTTNEISAAARQQIQSYCRSVNFTPGDYNKCVNREQKSLVANPLVNTSGISATARQQIQSYCRSVNFTPGDYNKCVNREQKSLVANPLVNTSGISATARQQIQSYCRSVNFTPGDYNKCANREQKSLVANPLVNTSGISAAARQQIQSYCRSVNFTPGDYNKCANREQKSLVEGR